MKTTNDQDQIWIERNENVVKVGFTKNFLDSLDQCWHIVPANMQRFREKAPLMVVETNDALISILSPISANFFSWNAKAQNFPDRLTDSDVVLEMRIGPVERAAPPQAPQHIDSEDIFTMADVQQVRVGGLGISRAATWQVPEPAEVAHTPATDALRRRIQEEQARRTREMAEMASAQVGGLRRRNTNGDRNF